MKKFVIIITTTIAIVAAWFLLKKPKERTSGFTITGTVTGFMDSTKIYLEDATPGEKLNIIDSTHIVNGAFSLKGNISSPSLNVMLTTKNNEDYKFMWIENADMTFVGEKGKFRDAVITGSATQQVADKLNTALKPINITSDSLNHAAKNDSFGFNQAAIARQFEALRNREIAISAAFVKDNPNSLVSAETLNTYATSLGKNKTQSLYNSLTPGVKNTIYGQSIDEYLELNKDLKIGDKYADFMLITPDEKAIKLSSYSGKVILLNFWASWCAPCRAENPNLIAIYRTYKSKGFTIFGVSMDATKRDWIDAIFEDKLTWPNVSDLKGDRCAPALIYGVSGIPDNFLIGKDGTILARNIHGQALIDKLQEVLK